MTTFKQFAKDTGLKLTVLNRHAYDARHPKPYKYFCELSEPATAEPYCFEFTKGPGLLEKKTGRGWEPAYNAPKAKTLHDLEVLSKTHRPEIPTIEEVLYCLASDSNAQDYCFVDWAEEYGYDTDSRAAERTYNACIDTAIGLRELLGWSGLNQLRKCEEE